MASDRWMTRPVSDKSLEDVAKEWDQIAHTRHMQISTGRDLSFNYVLKPTVLELLQGCNLKRVLDLGSGTGELTRELAKVSSEVVGVDFSWRSTEIARKVCSKAGNVSFYPNSVEVFASHWAGPQFTTIVANMTLMDCLNLDSLVEAAARLVAPEGCLIATITHPWFWPYYWGYANADWFCYKQEIVLEAPFQISAETMSHMTTHVHRPLSMYQNSLARAGFLIDQILEPYPDEEIHSLYPEKWRFPRFLAFRAAIHEAYREANGLLVGEGDTEE